MFYSERVFLSIFDLTLKTHIFCTDDARPNSFFLFKTWVEVKVDGLGGKWTVQSPKSGRSWVKVDGPKRHKVDGLRKWTVQKTKVDGPQKMKLDGPQNCVVNLKTMKVDGLRMRRRSKKG